MITDKYDHGHAWINVMCVHCGRRMDVPLPCQNRFCPICNKSRLMRTRRRLQYLAKNIKIPTGYSLKFLTLTMPAHTSCKRQTDKLHAAFRKLRHTRHWKENVDGGAFVIEVKRSKDPRFWHVHIHAVISSRELDLTNEGFLRRKWKRLVGGVSIRLDRVYNQSSLVKYLTKYITKTELDEKDAVIASQALKGRRLFQPFGTWHGCLANAPKLPACCPECGGSDLVLYSQLFRDTGFR